MMAGPNSFTRMEWNDTWSYPTGNIAPQSPRLGSRICAVAHSRSNGSRENTQEARARARIRRDIHGCTWG